MKPIIIVYHILQTELDSHKDTFKCNSPRDLMDVYLDMLHSQEKKPSFSGKGNVKKYMH